MNNIKKIVNYYGEQTQARKAIENLNGLAVAIANKDRKSILEGRANVFMAMEYLKEFDFFNYDEFTDIVVYKMKEQIEIIREESINE